jgi:hypothetical protein
MTVRGTILVLLAATSAACGGSTDECAGGCPAGQICFYGACVPDTDGGDTTEGGADADDGRVEIRDDTGTEDFSCDTSAPELCNGLDDDCDGSTDEGFPCVAGSTMTCTTACGTPGTGTCSGNCEPPGSEECRGLGGEVCNGEDDDCDGVCDNDFACCAGQIAPCTTACGSTGSTVCTESCELGTCIPPSETCNGADDDCDTTCDEGFGCCRGTVLPCTTTCRSAGTRVCGDTCAYPGMCTPPAETCNGVDDDCDGVCDNGFACCAGTGTPCTTACGTTGSRGCSGTCTLGTGECLPPAESCNGRDDDCDTSVDEGFACAPGTRTSCTTGCGSTGTAICTEACTAGTCTPPAELCGNGADDDCDGAIDEGCATNDTCAGAAPLSPDAPVSGDTTASADDSRGTCGTDGGRDVYYTFTLDEASDVFLHSVPSSYDSVLYVSATCGSSDLGCNDDIYNGYVTASGLVLRGLAAGTYHVAVDGYAATSAGTFDLTMYATPTGTNGDDCGTPLLVARPGTGSTPSVSGDTCTMFGQTAGSCGGVAGPESVYYFALRDRRTLTFSTCNTATTSDTTLYVRRACDDTTSELGCNDNGSSSTPCLTNPLAATLTVTLDAGLYFLYVDSPLPLPGTCGAYRVDISGMF